MKKSIEIPHPAVVLCGGRGSRLGAVSEKMPKPMVEVQGRPMIWYIVLNLYKHGVREFIFPLGYMGHSIRDYISNEFYHIDCKLHFKETGENTPIAGRINQIMHLIDEEDDFLLVNGDTFFDFDLNKMFCMHKNNKSLLTLSSISVKSAYGLIVEDQDNSICGFARDKSIEHFVVEENNIYRHAYVNSGITIVNKSALELIDLNKTDNFEHALFGKVIRDSAASHFKIDGDWFAVDTQKDLNVINMDYADSIGEKVKMAKKNLLERYTYSTRYIDSIEEFKSRIKKKTVIPHQVEIQPGPTSTKELCWLKCPYCYGLSAKDDGLRLSDRRYVEIMRQIADGGVNKVIFAGYATDPLNYNKLSDLVDIAIENRMICGFHTKAIKVNDRLISQITSSDIADKSYFSVSIDSGNNHSYNKVHGVGNSKAKLYDKVIENLRKINTSRMENGSAVDLSATYLINNINNSSEEVIGAINDLKNAGVDIIRFTFPQVPRHYDLSQTDDYIPNKMEIKESMDRLKPIIDSMNSSECQVVIMNLDSEYNTYHKERTLPCYSRFVFPSIGFDGYLSHCSESSSPHFREMGLGNLMTNDFWDLYYGYDDTNIDQCIEISSRTMEDFGCRCDRKEHVVNQQMLSLKDIM